MGANAEAEAGDATVDGGGETDAGHPEGVGGGPEKQAACAAGTIQSA